jgi:hypothetical protein
MLTFSAGSDYIRSQSSAQRIGRKHLKVIFSICLQVIYSEGGCGLWRLHSYGLPSRLVLIGKSIAFKTTKQKRK